MIRKHCLQEATARAAAKDPRSADKGWEPTKVKANNNGSEIAGNRSLLKPPLRASKIGAS